MRTLILFFAVLLQTAAVSAAPSLSQVRTIRRTIRAKRLAPHQRVIFRGRLLNKFPELRARQKVAWEDRDATTDATFGSHHPAFRRLSKGGWYKDQASITRLQKLATKIGISGLSKNTAMADIEMISFDLEATSGRAGVHKKNGSFRAGWDEVMQLGYVIYRNGQEVKRGRINIRPDVKIDRRVKRMTKLSAEVLQDAPRFESVAGDILKLMQGRLLIGQSAKKNDWGWLRSNFARLGVDLGGPKAEAIADTHELSFHYNHQGAGLKALAERFGVTQEQAHDGLDDARVTGEVFHGMMREQKIETLGDLRKFEAQIARARAQRKAAARAAREARRAARAAE